MSGMWIGSIVHIDCGEPLGIFEGEISLVDGVNQTLSLINVKRNSVKCQMPEITLSTYDIKSLKIVESTLKKESQPKPSKEAFTQHGAVNKNASSPGIEDNQKRKGEGKRKLLKRPENKKWLKERDEACFSVPVDSDVLNNDFDFEKNLALFDKRAVFDEIDALCKGEHVRLVDCNKRTPTKYRHDENILNNDVPILKQITVSCKCDKEFVTDTGLVVPSVTVDFKNSLYRVAEDFGHLSTSRIEMIGRGACEMVLHLLGGSHRLNPQNTHQKPSVVVLCGPHIQGAQGANCARQLANHLVRTTVLTPVASKDNHPILAAELKLFSLSEGKTVNFASKLPSSVDLIVDALECHERTRTEDNAWMSNARLWTKMTKASILCLDPPPDCTGIDHNFILSPALPFAFQTNRTTIHICDIGLPRAVFGKVGCTYSSPFGSKFVIPLYTRNESA